MLIMLTGFSQVTPNYPTKIATPTAFKWVMADSVIWLPYGLVPSLREGAPTTRPGALFVTVTTTDTLVKLWTGERWIDIGGTQQTNFQQNELIFGGTVTPMGGSNFFVQEAIYRIDGVVYQTPDDTVVISDSDPDLNRIDRIYLSEDNSGAHVLEGEPATNALEPQVESDQIGLAFISIPAGEEPTISSQYVYNDNAGESNVTNTGTTTDPNSTLAPYGGSAKAIRVTNINDPTNTVGDLITITKTIGNWNVLGFGGLSYAIKLNAVMPGAGNLRVQLIASGIAVSTEVIIPLNKSNITSYQLITTSAAAFGNITNTSITAVRFRYTRPGSTANYAGFDLDNVFFTTGVTQQPVGNVSITQIPPAGFNLTPQQTITNTGTWTWVSTGLPGQYYSSTGWADFPGFITDMGDLDGRTRSADGATIDGNELFLQTVDATEPGLATPDMFNRIYTRYYLQNGGNLDTLAYPINDTITGIKSIEVVGTGVVKTITDTTILYDLSGFTPGAAGLDDVLLENQVLTINHTIDGDNHSITWQDMQMAFTEYGDNTITGTPTTLAAFDVDGNLIEVDYSVISGGGQRFGATGEDDAAAETRFFDLGANNYTIDGTDPGNISLYLDDGVGDWSQQIYITSQATQLLSTSLVGDANILIGGGKLLFESDANDYEFPDLIDDGTATKVVTFNTVSKKIGTTDISGLSGGSYTDEQAQDAAAALFTPDNGDIDFTYNDGTPDISAAIKAGVIVNADINASAAIDATKIADGTVTSAEFQFINTLSSNAQTQIDGKQATLSNSAGLRGALSDELGTGAALFDGATPSTGLVLTNSTGLPVSTGISGLGANVATFLATATSANLAAALSDEEGSAGGFVRATSPTITTPTISGTITTTAAAQNGTNASGTGTIPYVHKIYVRSDETLANNNSDQNLFTNTAHDVITVQANTTYAFFLVGDLTHGATSHSVALGFTPTTATVTNIEYTAFQWVTAVGTQTASQTSVRVKSTATTVINAAGANATESFVLWGTITIGATGGTITPQIKFSSDPTGTILLKAGSRMEIWAIGDNTFTEQGPIN